MGDLDRQIAAALGIKRETVWHHVKQMIALVPGAGNCQRFIALYVICLLRDRPELRDRLACDLGGSD